MKKQDHIEYPKLRPIKGTDLAYILTPCAVNYKNGFDKYIEYKMRQCDWVIRDEDPKSGIRILREYCYKIYKRHGKSIEEIEKDIKDNTATLVGDMMFAVANQNLELDENGNLLLKSYGSDLENIKIEGGDVLLSKDGDVLRRTYGHMFIHEADACGNYFCDVFVADRKPMSDIVDIKRIDYNFLDARGKLIRKQNFERTDTPTLHKVNRYYRDEKGDKVFLDKDIYPTSYIFDPGKNSSEKPYYFPSPAMLLVENRARLMDNPNATPFVKDETTYTIEHYRRLNDINRVQQKLTKKVASGSIDFDMYKRAMKEIITEQEFNKIFTEFENENDEVVRYAVECNTQVDTTNDDEMIDNY